MTSSQERSFQRQIEQNPTDPSPRLVYADWLEEQNDPRAAAIRKACRYRLPFTRKELEHLSAIATAVEGPLEEVQVDDATLNASLPSVAEADRNLLTNDLSTLSPMSLVSNFPRDDRGRLLLDCSVLLAEYGFSELLESVSTHRVCLAAVGPARRKDEQIIQVQLLPCNPLNFEHGWFFRRPWWNSEAADSATDRSNWDDPLADIAGIAPLGNTKQLRQLEGKSDGGEETMALATLLLDAGRFEDAMDVCGVSTSPEVTKMLNAEAFSIQGDGGCDCQFEKAKTPENRAARLRRELWESAPWNFAAALDLHEQRLNARRKNKQPGELFLYIVPQQIHSRRARLTIVRQAGKPHLDFRFTASNVKPWRWTWKRPLTFDIQRSAEI